MARHTLHLTYTYDDASDAAGSLTIEHRAACDIPTTKGPHTVTHTEDVALEDAAPLVGALRAIVETNREHLDAALSIRSVQLAAAVNEAPAAGVKTVRLTGTLAPSTVVRAE